MSDYDNDLTGYEEHLRDSQYLGDARRCPRHPHVKTSSDDGMFDAPCGECEYEMDAAAAREDWEALTEEERERIHAQVVAATPVVYVDAVDDDIPF